MRFCLNLMREQFIACCKLAVVAVSRQEQQPASLAGGETRAEVWAQGTTPGLRLEVQESFVLPAEAAQVPTWGRGWMERLEVEKAIEHWEGEPAARKGGWGHWGHPDQLRSSFILQLSGGSSGHASLVLAWSHRPLPGLYPLSPGYSLKDKEGISMDLSH